MSPLRTALLALLVGAAVAGFSVWPGDIPLFWGLALAVPAAALTVLGARFAGPLEPSWAAVPDEASSATQTQATTLAVRLAEAAHDQARFHSRVRPRLRALALARLRERPETRDVSDMDDPRARAALGADLHELLTSPRAVLPAPARLAELLDRLEDA